MTFLLPTMKLRNTLLSLLRHAFTTLGGALVVGDDPKLAALGTILVAIGGLWGSADEHKAENPGGGIKLPPVAPLLLCALLGAGIGSTLLGGCSTVASSPVPAETQRLAAYTLTKNATLLVLQKEPQAEASLAALAAGIDTVFAAGELKPEQLKAALDALHVSPKSQLLVASALTDAYNLYVAATGKRIVVTTDPTATAILKGVQAGLVDGIAFARAFAGAN